jgi:transcription elongation factor GreA
MPVTREGYLRLQAELEILVTVTRREIDAWLREARQDGADPGENTDVAAALDERAALEGRIADLRTTLALASIAEPTEGTAGVGQRVLLRLGAGPPVEYHLVGPAEADVGRRRISVASPVGRALTGRCAGDSVQVETPGGARTVEIVAIGDVWRLP